jgi:hypothetical protein
VARPRRRPREQHAIEREYAQVSVEILNLSGKYSNCRLKMVIGGAVGGFSGLTLLTAYFSSFGAYLDSFQLASSFIYFFMLIGGVMIIMGVSDYLGRSQYRQRIHELEERRSHLRERMFEAYAAD